MMKVLGVDPGSVHTGYALIEVSPGRTHLLTYGTAPSPPEERLKTPLKEADVVVLERPNMSRLYNRAVRKKLGELLAAERLFQLAATNLNYQRIRIAAQALGKKIAEYPGFAYGEKDEATWKQRLVGGRHPTHAAVRMAIKDHVNLGLMPSEDVVDAIGLALVYMREHLDAAHAA